MQGLGKYLGYRALAKKIREVHCMNVPRDLVYGVMNDVNAEALAEHSFLGKLKNHLEKDRLFLW